VEKSAKLFGTNVMVQSRSRSRQQNEWRTSRRGRIFSLSTGGRGRGRCTRNVDVVCQDVFSLILDRGECILFTGLWALHRGCSLTCYERENQVGAVSMLASLACTRWLIGSVWYLDGRPSAADTYLPFLRGGVVRTIPRSRDRAPLAVGWPNCRW
jgi:hypothetical protein